jgi:hypothetical protein
MRVNMKRAITNIPAIVILMLLLLSCERIIEFRGENVDPKTVIYCMLDPDSIISVSVSRSHAVFDIKYEPQQITDAVVRLYCNEELVETLTYVSPPPPCEYCPPTPHSRYVSTGTRPVAGSTYRIEAELPGMKMASGETTLPALVPILGIDTTEIVTGWGVMQMVVKVSMSDPGETDNYYRLTANRTDGAYYGDKEQPWNPEIPVTVFQEDCSYSSYDEPLIAPLQEEEDLFGMYIENRYFLFNDELIAGKNYDLTLKIDHSWPDPGYYEFSHFNFRLETVSRELYLYLRSLSAHQQTNDNFLTEPVLVYTNIENGLGVVGARVSSAVNIEIGEYPVAGVTYQYGF